MNEIKNKEELKKALENLRGSKYSNIPADLLSNILDELSQTSDNSKAMRDIETMVRQSLKK